MDYKESSESDASVVAQLRTLNQMTYLRPSQSSLINSRVTKILPANQNASAGSTSYFILNTGNDFVYGPSTCLKLVARLTKVPEGIVALNTVWGTANGSILNIFDSVRLTHRSGEGCEYIQNCGVLGNILRLSKYSRDDLEVIDTLLASTANESSNVTPFDTAAGSTIDITCLIPLSLLGLGSFDSSHSLIPPSYLAGSRLEFVFLNNSQIFTNAAEIQLTSVTMSLLVDSYQAYDAANRQIMEETSGNLDGSGLQFTFDTYFSSNNVIQPGTSNVASSGAANNSVDVQNNVTIMSKAFFVLRQSAALSLSTAEKMSFFNSCTSLQWRLGSTYYPNQAMILRPVTEGTTTKISSNVSQAFLDYLLAFNALPNMMGMVSHQVAQSYALYAGNGVENDSENTIYAQMFDRSPGVLSFSGLPSNNARLLNISFSNMLTTSTIITYFVQSTRVANLIGDSCIIDR